MLRGFDRFARRARLSLIRHYGSEFADSVLSEARVEFQRVLPEIPYIGGRRNIFTPVMIVNGWMVALYRAMAARGKTAEDVIRVCSEVSDEFLRMFPSFVLKLAGRLAFNPLARRIFKRQAARSQARAYPEDFVWQVKEGGGDDVALVFEECAVNKFYDRQHLEELKPYCNFFDVTYSRLMGMGINANETIGLGCSSCSLRYKHGRETEIPKRLEGVLPGTG